MQHQTDGKYSDPVGLIEQDHYWQIVLCEALEHIADTLPNNFDPDLLHLTSEALKVVISEHNLMEEQALFPLLAKRVPAEIRFFDMAAQLSSEHETDQALALELAEQLEIIVSGSPRQNAEMLGYMLRSFFVSLRRHISWENQTILPLARNNLSSDDLEELRQWMLSHPEMSRSRLLLKAIGKFVGYGNNRP